MEHLMIPELITNRSLTAAESYRNFVSVNSRNPEKSSANFEEKSLALWRDRQRENNLQPKVKEFILNNIPGFFNN